MIWFGLFTETLGYGLERIMFCLKIPVLVTNMPQDVVTNHQKYQVINQNRTAIFS